MIISRSITFILLSAFTVYTAKWSQYVFGSDDKCSNIHMIMQGVVPDSGLNICSGANGTCLVTGFLSTAATCFDGVPKSVPEQAKTGQWVQGKSYSKGDCSSDPSIVTYYKADACFRSFSGKWAKLTCGGSTVIGFECTDNKCTKCSEVAKTQTNFCNTTFDASSAVKASLSTCLNNGQQQSGPNNSAAKIATFGIIPLISAVIVALF